MMSDAMKNILCSTYLKKMAGKFKLCIVFDISKTKVYDFEDFPMVTTVAEQGGGGGGGTQVISWPIYEMDSATCQFDKNRR